MADAYDQSFLIGLRGFAETESQRSVLEAIIEHGSQRQACRHLAMNPRTVQRTFERIKTKAATKGFAPASHLVYEVPDGQKLRGVSTLFDKRNQTAVMQWVKTSADEARQDEIKREVIEALKEELPRYEPAPVPLAAHSDLLTSYVISDYHFGMLAWPNETRNDEWNLETAERLLIDWFRVAMSRAPDSERAVFAEMGDFLHFDGLEAVTPTNRHSLDADTRFQKMVRVVIRVTRRIVDLLLKKHKHVHLIFADANHDPASGAWLREWFSAVYADEPRITVDTSADSYYCVEHGLTSVFFHHGHKRQVANVDDVFAAKFREVFGRTKYSYAHLGHLHSNESKETPLMMVERHRTLAAPDAYAAKGGWVSGRDAKVITYHKQYGEFERIVISPAMVAYEAMQ